MNSARVSATVASTRERPLPPLPIEELEVSAAVDIPDNTARSLSNREDREHGGSKEEISSHAAGNSIVKSRANSASAAGSRTSTAAAASLDEGSFQPASSQNQRSSGGNSVTESNVPIGAASNPPAYQAQEDSHSQAITPIRDVDIETRPHGGSSGSDSPGDTPLLSRTSIRYRRRPRLAGRANSTEQSQVLVPRWQPDAEVTLCPICRTQFSFFVRKHHCRKCGRVVCGSCSPHRITIPHQFIVQPPSEATSPTKYPRPALDAGRVGSFTAVENLGGGERVRLCNPCVPDPNVAPPQVADNRRRPSHQGHSHSEGNTATSTNSPSIQSTQIPTLPSTFPRRPRQPSNSSLFDQSRSSYTEGNHSRLVRSEELHNRSRSNTVGTNRDTFTMNYPTSQTGHSGTGGGSRQPRAPLPRPTPEARPPLNEEDECWVCHKELPSKSLPNWETARQNHVMNCVLEASTNTSTQPYPAASSSRTPPVQIPTPNTPEGRMVARESAHAAVIQAAQSSHTPPMRRSGCFPYVASEKDCVDDAECTICMEEYQVGDKMGRLECFCRFHLHCIRDWFVHHPGQCPVHQHGAGY
ncbi:uncharacterized protein L3040_009032 [Drepanopeziza brunnea f. sp. 'multigermtubi']|uniref:uncharacterized protein n=1 Tax=Drepanopeziza brunnea f. sp. 'multigermtubi' TaxID=698441 RepID=UPI00238F860E|nr:hypothetical protein L3040_009032 [Drepanopeziza brunnea f. sp. 'multigermtubi']